MREREGETGAIREGRKTEISLKFSAIGNPRSRSRHPISTLGSLVQLHRDSRQVSPSNMCTHRTRWRSQTRTSTALCSIYVGGLQVSLLTPASLKSYALDTFSRRCGPTSYHIFIPTQGARRALGLGINDLRHPDDWVKAVPKTVTNLRSRVQRVIHEALRHDYLHK